MKKKTLTVLIAILLSGCQVQTPPPAIRVYRERDFSPFAVCPVITIPKPISIQEDLVNELSKIKGNDTKAQKQADIIVTRYINKLKDAVAKKNKELEETHKRYWESCYNYDVNKNKRPSDTKPKKTR